MHGLTQRIERVADDGEVVSAMFFYTIKLSQGWVAKLPCAVIAGIIMHHLGIVTTITDWLSAQGVAVPQLGLLTTYALLWCVDFLTGFGGALVRKEVKSSKLTKGLGKVVAHLGLLGGACIAGANAPTLLQWVPEATFAYLALTELVSVIENLRKMGFGSPLLDKLAALFKKGGVK